MTVVMHFVWQNASRSGSQLLSAIFPTENFEPWYSSLQRTEKGAPFL